MLKSAEVCLFLCGLCQPWGPILGPSPRNPTTAYISSLPSLSLSVCAPGMERGPVLRSWIHWSQSCCWKKAQTRFHSRGGCSRKSVGAPHCSKSLQAAKHWCSNLCLSADMTHHCGDTVVSVGLHLTAALLPLPLTFWPLHICHSTSSHTRWATCLRPFYLYVWVAMSSQIPLPKASAYSMCHTTVNSLFRVIICET